MDDDFDIESLIDENVLDINSLIVLISLSCDAMDNKLYEDMVGYFGHELLANMKEPSGVYNEKLTGEKIKFDGETGSLVYTFNLKLTRPYVLNEIALIYTISIEDDLLGTFIHRYNKDKKYRSLFCRLLNIKGMKTTYSGDGYIFILES